MKTSNFSDSAEIINMKIVSVDGKESNLVKLNSSPSDNGKEKFLKDSLDVFKIEELDIGQVWKFLAFFSKY